MNDLGNPKSKKVKEIPANYEVCEPCKNYLDNNEDIPLVLLAKLIKFRLLDVKQKDIQRRDAEKKVGIVCTQHNSDYHLLSQVFGTHYKYYRCSVYSKRKQYLSLDVPQVFISQSLYTF